MLTAISILPLAAIIATADPATSCSSDVSAGNYDAPRVYSDLIEALNGDPQSLAAFDARYGADADGSLTVAKNLLGSEARVDEFLWCFDDTVGARVDGSDGKRGFALFIDVVPGDEPQLVSIGLRRQAPAQPPQPVGEAERTALIEALQARLRQDYVLPDVGQAMANALAKANDEGRYDRITSPRGLALRLTQDLKKVYRDGHLYIFDPTAFVERQQILDGSHGGGELAQDEPSVTSRTITINDYRIAYVKVAGRIGGDAATIAAVDQARAVMAEAESVIFDLREAIGGDGDVLPRLANPLFANATLLTRSDVRDPETGLVSTSEMIAGPDNDGPIIAGRVAILTSDQTASAAEAFAFGLQRSGRATLFGDTTYGAGHRVDSVALADGYGLNLSIGRTYDPRTGKGWDAVGIAPDRSVNPRDALFTAVGWITGLDVSEDPHQAVIG